MLQLHTVKQHDHYRQILRLVSRIGRLTNPQHLPVLKQMHISLAQFLALDALSVAGGPIRMTELALEAGLSPSELTRVVAELEGKEWAARDVDSEDSRVRLVRATRAGTQLIRKVHGQATAELRGVWSDFTHDEWHRFIDYLNRFEQGMGRVRSIPARSRAKKPVSRGQKGGKT